MKCPYCAGEIEEHVAKCRHCGEWIDETKGPSTVAPSGAKPDYSSYRLYSYRITGQNRVPQGKFALDISQESLRATLAETMPEGYALDEKRGLRAEPEGRFTCPNCGCRYTDCSRDVGCAVLIIIFISLGLGLIMIPFLPFKCQCHACNYKWKT